MIYLDNAATTFPKPQCVINDVMRCLRCDGANPGRGGHTLSVRAGEAVFETRALLADVFHGTPQRVIFCKNCTESINVVLKGVLQPGDHAIISSLEHNAVLRPLEVLRQTRDVSFDVASVCADDDAKTVANFEALIRPETKLIFCTHVSNVFGTVLPIQELATLAKKHGLLFGVDAAQSAGTEAIDVRQGIDFLCMPGHKGLLAPMGTGVLLLQGDTLPHELMEGGTGSASMSAAQPEELPERYESGTLNLPGIVGLRAGLRYLQSIGGPAQALRHEQALVQILKEDLSVIPQVELFDSMHTGGRGTLLSFRLKGCHSEQTAQRLDRCGFAVRAGYHCARLAHLSCGTEETGTVRVSPGLFTTRKQIKNFTFCLNQIAKQKKIC